MTIRIKEKADIAFINAEITKRSDQATLATYGIDADRIVASAITMERKKHANTEKPENPRAGYCSINKKFSSEIKKKNADAGDKTFRGGQHGINII